MAVVTFLLGKRGRESRTDLGKGWSNSFLFPHYRSCLGSKSVERYHCVNCQERNLFTAVLTLPHVNFGEEIQGEDDFQAQRGKRVSPPWWMGKGNLFLLR